MHHLVINKINYYIVDNAPFDLRSVVKIYPGERGCDTLENNREEDTKEEEKEEEEEERGKR